MKNELARRPLIRRIAPRLLLVLGSAIVALVLAELSFRLFSNEKVELHGMYTADETVGVALTPGFEGSMQTSEFQYHVRVNDLGMRDRPVPESAPGETRILMLGDSFVFGVGVELEDSLSKVLERRLNARAGSERFVVLNGGVGGYSTFQELHTLRKLAPVVQPDLVVLVFFMGDDWYGNGPRTPPEEVRNTLRGRLQVNSALYRAYERIVLSRLKGRDRYEPHLIEPSEEFAERERHVLELLEETRSVAQGHGAELLVVLNPRFTQVYDDAWGKAALVYRLSDEVYSPAEPNERFVRALEERDFWVADLLDPLQEAGAERLLHFPNDGHWTPEGTEIVGDLVLEALEPWLEEQEEIAARSEATAVTSR